MTRPVTLFMPLEIKARDLHGRLLMACLAVEKGMTTVLGQIQELRQQLPYMDPGIYVSKSATERLAKRFRDYRSYGHQIVAWDEEGLVFLDAERYQREKVSPDSLDSVDLFFAWGENQVEAILAKVPGAKAKIVLTGNPRFDVLRNEFHTIYEEEVKEIGQRFKDFILINGTFGRYNHHLGIEGAIEDLTKIGIIRTDQDRKFIDGYVEYDEILFKAFQSLIDALRKQFPESAVVVRPHPSENISVWHEYARSRDNVHVAFEGSAIPWILASQVMIHSGCTTGVESYFLEKHAICYRPVAHSIYDPELPSLLNHTADTEQQVCQLVKHALNGALDARPNLDQEARKHMRRFIVNADGELASEQIVDKLSSLTEEQKADPMITKLRRITRRTKRLVSRNSESAWDRGVEQQREDYRTQKFPGLARQELQNYIKKIDVATKGRARDILVTPLEGTFTCYRIHK